MKREVLFIQKISEQADTFYSEGERFGKWAKQAFPARDRSQMKGLENIANSSLKVSDVLDFIKKQTGKSESGKRWRAKNDQQQEFGKQLIAFIMGTLKNKRDLVCSLVASIAGQEAATDFELQQSYLALIREFIRQIVAHYELEAAS